MARRKSMSQRESFRPLKRLGQNFLVDPNIPEKIISSAGFQSSDVVLEIGPGQGALTLPLSRTVSRIVAVEKDARLADFLQRRLTTLGISTVDLVCQDILRVDFGAIPLPSSQKIQVIGNLPYNISSPVLKKLIDHREKVSRAVLMFQREVAERLTAPPCARGYGAMTLLIRYHARPMRLFEVPRSAFYPIPKVDSMVIELDFERPYPSHGVDENAFRNAVKGAFAHRRKTVLNSLKGFLPVWTPDVVLKGLRASSIDPARRAETLTMDEFLMLSSMLTVDNREMGRYKYKFC